MDCLGPARREIPAGEGVVENGLGGVSWVELYSLKTGKLSGCGVIGFVMDAAVKRKAGLRILHAAIRGGGEGVLLSASRERVGG